MFLCCLLKSILYSCLYLRKSLFMKSIFCSCLYIGNNPFSWRAYSVLTIIWEINIIHEGHISFLYIYRKVIIFHHLIPLVSVVPYLPFPSGRLQCRWRGPRCWPWSTSRSAPPPSWREPSSYSSSQCWRSAGSCPLKTQQKSQLNALGI